MQIPSLGDDEYMVGPDDQSFRDQLDRHRSEARENFVKSGGDGSQVIDDDDGHAEIGRQVPQQSGIRIKATGRAAHANNRTLSGAILGFHDASGAWTSTGERS